MRRLWILSNGSRRRLEVTERENTASHYRDFISAIIIAKTACQEYTQNFCQLSIGARHPGSINCEQVALSNAKEVAHRLNASVARGSPWAITAWIRQCGSGAFQRAVTTSSIGCREDELSDENTHTDLLDGKMTLHSAKASSVNQNQSLEMGLMDYAKTYRSISTVNGQDTLIDCCGGVNGSSVDELGDKTPYDAAEEAVVASIEDRDHCMVMESVKTVELQDEVLKKQQFSRKNRCQNQSTKGDFYEEVKLTDDVGEPLMPRSLLDMAVEDVIQAENEEGRLLWKKFKTVAARKRRFTCKSVIQSWLEEGNIVTRPTLIYNILAFRSWKKNKRALELFDWVIEEKPFELTDMDHAIYMDLVGKIGGHLKASKYYTQIPKPCQTPMVYSVLLAAFVDHNMEKCARRLLSRARVVGLREVFLYNQVLLFYKGKGRISDVADLLKQMEDIGVNPDLYTYNMLLDLRARKGDIVGMREIWKRLEIEQNLKPDAATYALLARGYVNAGLLGKAECAIRRIEARPYPRKQQVYRWLLKLYGHLKRDDHVERVWELLKNVSRALIDDYSIMIQSLGEAGEVRRAEEIFEEGVKRFGIKRLHQYHALVSVYLSHGLIQKAESLMEKMSRDSFQPGSATYHQLIEMHVRNGDEKKAMEALLKAQNANKIFSGHKPWYASYITILEVLGERGDVECAEAVITDMKSAGYPCGFKVYNALLKAYVKADRTPYGFLDRMRADGAIPNTDLRKELNKVSKTERGFDLEGEQPF